MKPEFTLSNAQREQLQHTIDHLDHILPGQAPIHDFVHHNTLHGFQHLPFTEALTAYRQLTGIDCYLPEYQFQQYYREGRINNADLQAVLTQHGIAENQLDWYRAALLADLTPINPAQLTTLPLQAELWHAVLAGLQINPFDLHPEDWLDLSTEQIQQISPQLASRQTLQQQALTDGQRLFASLGEQHTLRSLLLALCGEDLLDQVRPLIIRWCAAWLDEGMAAWTAPDMAEQGLYASWRRSAAQDIQAGLQGVSDWQGLIKQLPDDALTAIAQQLTALGVAEAQWPHYLERVALELPGWAGLLNWRQTHPNYAARQQHATPLADYLALRLLLDRAFAQPICHRHWHLPARIDRLRSYFQQHWAELAVRLPLMQAQLPEYLTQAARQLLVDHNRQQSDWQRLAEQVWTWQVSQQTGGAYLAHQHGWPIYQLCRQLSLSAAQVTELGSAELQQWLSRLQTFTTTQRQQIWLQAYEQHYRQNLLGTLAANYGRGRWYERDQRPQAQIIFCMDDREEAIRRHLEEHNPRIETLGAAGFFGVAMNYRGLEDEHYTPLCPVVVTPSHNVQEQPQAGQQPAAQRHHQRGKLGQKLALLIHHGLRRDAVLAAPLTLLSAPLTLLNLLAKSSLPRQQQALVQGVSQRFQGKVATELLFTAPQPDAPASEQQPRLGYNDHEQADRVAGLLRNTGLTYGFGELVVLMGHGSMSQNNPHLSAYDCGACSGRHGGPNARLFAAMANRPEVRQLLAERGIVIPNDTWFIGAEHNTADEVVRWYDVDQIPSEFYPAMQRLELDLRHAQLWSAHERCRRLASAPRKAKLQQAWHHFQNRVADFSQARPELGHATNAAALIGRRALSQGGFFDRRLFLISYDPTQDLDGKILEGILLAVGPVGAGINLEYYFSTVNNQRLGCGSKVPHNLTGFFGVMEGTSSDLRTGLPKQMIEIHEAMRLQIIVEAKLEILQQIYARQPSLSELIGGGWVLLNAIDPDDGAISIFDPQHGFVPWQAPNQRVAIRDNSPDAYRGASGPVDPLLIRQADLTEAR